MKLAADDHHLRPAVRRFASTCGVPSRSSIRLLARRACLAESQPCEGLFFLRRPPTGALGAMPRRPFFLGRTMSKTKTGARRAQPQDRRVCKSCGHTKPIELFKKSGNGRGSICKVCDAERARARWHADPKPHERNVVHVAGATLIGSERNSEQGIGEIQTSRGLRLASARSERGRVSNARATARYRQRHPEVSAAQRQARAAVRKGRLAVPKVCEVRGCGRTGASPASRKIRPAARGPRPLRRASSPVPCGGHPPPEGRQSSPVRPRTEARLCSRGAHITLTCSKT